jgi:hypothetical protein
MFLAAAVLALEGCAMTVGLKVQRLPAMNAAGIKRIAVMPFETNDNSRLQRETARFITVAAASRILEAGYFTLVDPAEVERLRKNGENLENYVDALLTGQVITLNTKDRDRREKRAGYKTGEEYYVTYYDREAELVFSYSFKRARDGTLVGAVTKGGVNKDSNENRNNLRSKSDLLQVIVIRELRELAHDAAPYTVKETRTLLPEKSKDRVLQAQMKEAYKTVKNGSYRTALKAHL